MQKTQQPDEWKWACTVAKKKLLHEYSDVMSEYTKEVRQAKEAFDEKLEHLAYQFRKSILIPFCKRNGLEFTAGMGRYFFSIKSDEAVSPFSHITVDSSDANVESTAGDIYRKTGMQTIFGVLDAQVDYNTSFGDYCQDVTLKQKKRKKK